MGLLGAFLPFGSATALSDHNGAFLWMNFRNIFGLLALITYILCWILVVVVVVLGVLTLGFGLIFLFVPFLIWLPFDLIALALGIPGTLFHLMSCKGDNGIGSAFTSFGLTVTGVCTLSMYGFILHILCWVLLWVGIGLFGLFVVYILSVVCLVMAVIAAKKEA